MWTVRLLLVALLLLPTTLLAQRHRSRTHRPATRLRCCCFQPPGTNEQSAMQPGLDTLTIDGPHAVGQGKLSADGLEFYVSLLADNGRSVIGVMRRASLDAPFSAPVPLVLGMESDSMDAHQPAVSADGRTLVFVMTPHNLWQENELWMAERASRDVPFNAARPLNEVNKENVADSYPWVSSDGLRVYYTLDNKIVVAGRSSVGATFRKAQDVKIGQVGSVLAAWLSEDERTIYVDERTSPGIHVVSATRAQATGIFDDVKQHPEFDGVCSDGNIGSFAGIAPNGEVFFAYTHPKHATIYRKPGLETSVRPMQIAAAVDTLISAVAEPAAPTEVAQPVSVATWDSVLWRPQESLFTSPVPVDFLPDNVAPNDTVTEPIEPVNTDDTTPILSDLDVEPLQPVFADVDAVVGPGDLAMSLPPDQAPSSVDITAASTLALSEVVPNPARDKARLVLSLASPAQVTADLYTGGGVHVASITDERMTAGDHTFEIDAAQFPSGAYFCRVVADGVVATRPIVLVR